MDKVTLAVLIFVLVLSGCVTTRFNETTVDADGSNTTTTYKATSAAWPLGKVDTTNHEFGYKYGGAENTIATGQQAAGIDNTGQQALVEFLGTLVMEGVKAYVAGIPVVAPAPLGGN